MDKKSSRSADGERATRTTRIHVVIFAFQQWRRKQIALKGFRNMEEVHLQERDMGVTHTNTECRLPPMDIVYQDWHKKKIPSVTIILTDLWSATVVSKCRPRFRAKSIIRSSVAQRAGEKNAKTKPTPMSKMSNTRYVMIVPRMVDAYYLAIESKAVVRFKGQVPVKTCGRVLFVRSSVHFEDV